MLNDRAFLFAAVLVLATSSKLTAGPMFMGIGFLDTDITVSRATAVSADGSVVVGTARNADGSQEAFRWTARTGMVGLGDLPGGIFTSRARNVSADGSTVVGESWTGDGLEAFRWTPQTGMTGLGDFPDGIMESRAFGVSHDGSTVVGVGRHDPYPEAFRWTQSEGMVGLGFLPGGGHAISYARDITPDGTRVAGAARSAIGDEVFVWTPADGMVGLGNMVEDPEVWSISADGSTIVGEDGESDQAFRLTDAGEFEWLAFPGARRTIATDVSGDGSLIVGLAIGTTGGLTRSFIWDELNGVRDLSDVLTSEYGLDLQGWMLEQALGISDDGMTIVGVGRGPGVPFGPTEGWIAVIPEPPTHALLLLPCLLLLLRRRGLTS